MKGECPLGISTTAHECMGMGKKKKEGNDRRKKEEKKSIQSNPEEMPEGRENALGPA
jgi:hypothetical protein